MTPRCTSHSHVKSGGGSRPCFCITSELRWVLVPLTTMGMSDAPHSPRCASCSDVNVMASPAVRREQRAIFAAHVADEIVVADQTATAIVALAAHLRR